MKKRLLISLLALFVALVVLDLVAARLTRDGWFMGLRVPPFGLQSGPDRQAALARRIEQLERGPLITVRAGFDPLYGWINRPGTYTVDGVEQHINSIGARGRREVASEPAPGVLRVACFGESYTFGSEVLDGEDWPAQLQDADESLEVINLGNSGWGTDQALILWREVGATLGSDVVFIGLLLENIRRNVNRYRAFAYAETVRPIVKPRFRFLSDELVLLRVPYPTQLALVEAARSGELREHVKLDDWWAGSDPVPAWSGLARAYEALAHERRRDPVRMWSRRDAEPYRTTLALLEAFHREALAAGAEAAPVLVFPGEEDLARLRTGRKYWGGLLASLDRLGIPWIDLSEPLAARADPDAMYGGVHLSPQGNGVVAEHLARWLGERFPER